MFLDNRVKTSAKKIQNDVYDLMNNETIKWECSIDNDLKASGRIEEYGKYLNLYGDSGNYVFFFTLDRAGKGFRRILKDSNKGFKEVLKIKGLYYNKTPIFEKSLTDRLFKVAEMKKRIKDERALTSYFIKAFTVDALDLSKFIDREIYVLCKNKFVKVEDKGIER